MPAVKSYNGKPVVRWGVVWQNANYAIDWTVSKDKGGIAKNYKEQNEFGRNAQHMWSVVRCVRVWTRWDYYKWAPLS